MGKRRGNSSGTFTHVSVDQAEKYPLTAMEKTL
jgi:hypothetical protein